MTPPMKPGRARELAEESRNKIANGFPGQLEEGWKQREIECIESAIQAAVGEFADEAAKLLEKAECLDTCDSHCHDDTCPNVFPYRAVLELKKRWASKGEVSE